MTSKQDCLQASCSCGVRDMPIHGREEDDKGLRVFDYAQALEKFITETDTPMTIGIQGDWGSGKTSLMNLIESPLGKKFPTVWINTWKYSQADSGDALAQAVFLGIIRQLKEIDKTGKTKELISTMGWALAGVAGKVAAKQIGLDIGSAFAKGDIDKIFERYEALEKLKEQLKGLIKRVLENGEGGKDRVVVFVDDLDRIDPVRAVEILEILKIFLDIEGIVFVLACDYEVVRRGLKVKGGLGEDVSGRSFFDKIIQVPFRMPDHNDDKLENYMKGILDQIGTNICGEDITILIRVLEATTGSNPRTIKRLANIVNLLLIILDSEKHSWDDTITNKATIVFTLVALQNAYPKIYAAIARKSEDQVLKTWNSDTVKEMCDSDENADPDAITEKVNQVIHTLQSLVGKGGGATLLKFLHVSDMASVQKKTHPENNGFTKPVKGYLNNLPDSIRQKVNLIINGLPLIRMSKDNDSIRIYSANDENVWANIRKNRRCLDVIIPFESDVAQFVSKEYIEEKIRSVGAPQPEDRTDYYLGDLKRTDVFVIKIGENSDNPEVERVRDLLSWFLLTVGKTEPATAN